jgi:hypothetical protein
MALTGVRTIGDLARISVSVYDITDNLADPTTITATVTEPDGTENLPDVTRSSIGVYYLDFPVAQAGRHTVYWQTTGLNQGASVDNFDAQEIAPVLSVAEVKAHLNVTDYADDSEILAFIDAAVGIAEGVVGSIENRTVTETHNGGRATVCLNVPPVVSVSAVTENGTSVAASGWDVSTNGVLTRTSGYSTGVFTSGFNNVSVTYVSGRSSIPADLRHALKELVRHLWETQRGSTTRKRSGDDYQPGAGFSLPNRVAEVLDRYRIAGIA